MIFASGHLTMFWFFNDHKSWTLFTVNINTFSNRHRDEAIAKATELRKKGEVMAANKLMAGATRITYAMTTIFIRVSFDNNNMLYFELDITVLYVCTFVIVSAVS